MTPSHPEPRTAEPLMEKLASIEHDRWSRWHHYAKAHWEPDRIQRWDELALRLYEELSEEIKEKDREEVRKYWPLIEQAIDEARAEGFKNGEQSCRLKSDDYARGFSDARLQAEDKCSVQERIHHKYADSYEEGLRDMADLLGQAMEILQPSEK